MIKPGEIQKRAHESGVRDQQIEKDYIISWILQGIFKHEALSKLIVFKGGTVLKKVYFEDYRFSEDLDFTLLNTDISNEQIFEWFEDVFSYIREEANIPLEVVDNNEHKDGGINFYISYTGPLGGSGAGKKVKIDISKSEKLLFKTVMCDVFIGYTDLEEHQLLCYSLEEILIEKLRSVIQRMQARDFYDIWYLLEVNDMDASFYVNEFKAKCENKKIEPSSFHVRLEQRLPQYKARWERSMVNQINDLPEFKAVLREVMRHLRKLEV